MAGQGISCGDCHSLTGNRVPIANCGPDRGASVGVATKFSGLASYDHDGTIISYQWDFGDGTPNVSGSSVFHTFAATGTYEVSLTVTDNQGAVDTDTCIITVKTPSIKIDQVWMTDLNDVSKTIFKQGEVIRYHIRFTTEGGAFFTKAKGTARNITGPYWKQSFSKKSTIAEGTYHWTWDKTIPLTATPGSRAKVQIVVKIFDMPLGTLLGTSKKTAFFNIQ
jgi:PKD repeat protein